MLATPGKATVGLPSFRLHRRPRRLGRAMIVLVLLVGAAELVVRFWPRTPPIPRPPRAQLPGALPRLKGLPQLLAPHQRGLFRGELYETNSRGIRDREYAVPKPDGVFRVVVTGGSNVMGSSVAAEETYAARLEEALADREEPRFEVVNVALSGLNLSHALDRLETKGVPYQPDLIVYGFNVTDIKLGDLYRKSLARKVRKGREPSRSALLEAMRSGLEEWNEIQAAPGTRPAEFQENYFENEAVWRAYQEQLDRLAAIGAREGACVLVLVHTEPRSLHAFHPYQVVYDRVASAVRDRGMMVALSRDLYEGEDPRSLWASAVDPHANERSHEILEQALRRGLVGLPAACWKGAGPPL